VLYYDAGRLWDVAHRAVRGIAIQVVVVRHLRRTSKRTVTSVINAQMSWSAITSRASSKHVPLPPPPLGMPETDSPEGQA
jgi:hypothetical protein